VDQPSTIGRHQRTEPGSTPSQVPALAAGWLAKIGYRCGSRPDTRSPQAEGQVSPWRPSTGQVRQAWARCRGGRVGHPPFHQI